MSDTRYVALLRGINLGPRSRIADELATRR